MNEKYVLIERTGLKVYLLGTNSKPYVIHYNRQVMTMPYVMEAVYIKLVYGDAVGHMNRLVDQLRCADPDISPLGIDRFISKFKKEHVAEKVEYNINDVLPLGNPGQELDYSMSIFRHKIMITGKQERELLDIMINQNEKRRKIILWWDRYCDRYSIYTRRKGDEETKAEELAEFFCESHGIDLNRLQFQEKVPLGKDGKIEPPPTPWWKQLRNVAVILLLFCVYLTIAAGLIACAELDLGFLSFLFPVIGFCMIVVPLGMLKLK